MNRSVWFLPSAKGMNCLLVFPIWGTYPLLHGREDSLANRGFTFLFCNESAGDRQQLMEIYTNLSEIQNPFPQAHVTIGNFDGVHLGHQMLFDQVVAEPVRAREPV